jgi:hypothetical protein
MAKIDGTLSECCKTIDGDVRYLFSGANSTQKPGPYIIYSREVKR